MSVIKVALIRYGEVLGVDQLNGLPNRQSNLLFSQQFMEYSKTAEWKMYLEKKVQYICPGGVGVWGCRSVGVWGCGRGLGVWEGSGGVGVWGCRSVGG